MPSKTVQQKIERATTTIPVDLNLIQLQHLLQIHMESYDRDKDNLSQHSYLVVKLSLAINDLINHPRETDSAD